MIERLTAEEAAQAGTPGKHILGWLIVAAVCLAVFGPVVTGLGILAIIAVSLTRR